MKVFISWSGERSRAVALALRQWLPDVIQSVDPWMSSEDIEAGARWGSNVTAEISETRFGIICLTRDNQTAPWILFEAGALAKTIENTFVVPYLIDLEPADIQRGPLNQFQAKRANKTETWELTRTLNRRLESPLLESQIERTFEKWSPDLDKSLKELPQADTEQKGKRPTDDILEEVLELVIRTDLSSRRLLVVVNKHLRIRELEDRFESKSRASCSGIALGASPLGVFPQVLDHGLERAAIPRSTAIAQSPKELR